MFKIKLHSHFHINYAHVSQNVTENIGDKKKYINIVAILIGKEILKLI